MLFRQCKSSRQCRLNCLQSRPRRKRWPLKASTPPVTPVASVGQGSSSAGDSAGALAARKLDEKVEGMRDDMAKMGNMVADLSAAMGKFMGRPNE